MNLKAERDPSLRERLAEVLGAASRAGLQYQPPQLIAVDAATLALTLCADPALDAALEDAERVAALEAENAALRARIAGGVRVVMAFDHSYHRIELKEDEYTALLPLGGKTVVVMEDKP